MSIKNFIQPGKGWNKRSNNLFGFFYNYRLTIVLLVLLIVLIRQSFLVNNFPFVLYDKQKVNNQNILINQALDKKNKQLSTKIKAESEANMEILESIARYKFGLLKKGERYYQITQSR